MNRILAATTALALSACSFAPEVRRPDDVVPKEHRFAQPEETASVADLPWWELFKDPALQALIREALASNTDLAIAAARVERSRALAGVARADLYPQLGIQANAQYGQLFSKNIAPGSEVGGYGNLSAVLSWELDLWGRNRNSRDAFLAELYASEDVRRGVVLSLVGDVAQAYLELRALDLELEIARANTETRRGTLQMFEARARGGVASDLEVNQARSDLAVTTAAIPETELAIAVKEHLLSVLLGRPPGPIERGTALVDVAVPPALPLGVPAQLLARRPDVLAVEEDMKGAAARVGVAVANRIPTLSINALIGLEGASAKDVFSADALIWNAGASLFAPIFQGGRLKSIEEASRASYQEAVLQYRRTVQVALSEVANAAIGVRKLREVRLARADQVKATTASARLANLRYQGGVSSYLEVLDAQRQLFDSQLSLARTQRDELVSVVQLYRSLGGGWQEPPPEPVPAAPPPAQPAPPRS